MSSAHARRLSRLYIRACNHWTIDNPATIAKNNISGLILIAKSCGNDVSRLTFWLSNAIVLREIISQAFSNSSNLSRLTRLAEFDSCNGRREKVVGAGIRLQRAGSFSLDLWKNAFENALQLIFPLKEGGHECGCLPVIARMACWGELIGVSSSGYGTVCCKIRCSKVQSILRESADEIPIYSVSDPIIDSTVLPNPAGDLSFGSGAQL
ncbi:hypothetical protein V6N13_087692 [Hibiscus sabdariffa]